jgi:site-specific recombinase XerD
MLKALYPACFQRYTSLTVFGPIVDDFTTWLLQHHYTHPYIRQRIWLLAYMDSTLVRRGIDHPSKIDQADWVACRRSIRRQFPYLTDTTDALEKYLHSRNLLKPETRTISTTARYLSSYADYLETVRGAAASTIQQNSYTASELLAYLKIERGARRLRTLSAHDLEGFVKAISHRFTRPSLHSIVGRVRSFLRFLAVQGEVPQGLDRQIDTPHVYQEEQLPRALPWDTVQAFLDSIDRSSSVGLRDFTMFFLMAIYGLRASDVTALTLDNIHWRAGRISISQRKTGTILELPLTDEVGTALHRYLKRMAPPPSFRQLFLRRKAPIGPLKTAAISRRFWFWASRSKVQIRGKGACHRIRHSYAVFLLRKGTPVKIIGDLLGHRTVESTSTYLRLAIEDLRDVALPVPTQAKKQKAVRA